MKIIVFGFAFLMAVNFSFAQDQEVQKQCFTMEQDSINRIRYPQLGPLSEFERKLQEKIEEIEAARKAGRLQNEVITIPVIVHVIHNGEPVGEGTNLSQEQVNAQLEVLNEDFRREPDTRGFNDDPNGADIEIEFCAAAFNESGESLEEPGIHRFRGARETWTREEIEGILKPSTFWDPDRYFNIWVVNFSGREGLGGYAQFPSQSNLPGMPTNGGLRSTDGVVVWYRSFGSLDKGEFDLSSPSNRGRTLTHEVGHWLGLRHVWGDGPCSADDFCDDTPPSAGPNRGCPASATCNTPDAVENYMNYTDDVCMNMFTICQKTRMRAVMEISPRRGVLLTSNVCSPDIEIAPVANFRADRQTVLKGGSVEFSDISSSFPDELIWSFEGGQPESSDLDNPVVTYDEPGQYAVQLIAINEYGSDTIRREGYINVSNEGICTELSNFNAGTPTVIDLSDSADASGYVAGHNSLRHQAKAELFANELGYEFISGASIRFGYAYASQPDSKLRVLVWNDRGPFGGPGSVVEEVEVLISQVEQDIAEGKATEIVFSRPTPLFGKGFFVGIGLDYEDRDTVAIVTTQNGESTSNTAWEQNENGEWDSYALSWPLNVAHDIVPFVGMNPSVQLSSSDLVVPPGKQITLQAKGASIFQWEPESADISSTLGPQITAQINETTTFKVIGSGVELCREEALITIVVNRITGIENEFSERDISIFPNPAENRIQISMNNKLTGNLDIAIFDAVGNKVLHQALKKHTVQFEKSFDLGSIPKGVYIMNITLNNKTLRERIVKF